MSNLGQAVERHAAAYRALGLPDESGVPEAKRGSVFIGLATGILFAQLYPEKAGELLAAITLMRNAAIGNDQLWEDLVEALAGIDE